ncbi:hypothetical protein ACP70R_018705 [Stipagrostis hirtigluma subsp. patula]
MEIILPAFLGEITQRSVSFFIDKLCKETSSASQPSDDEHLRSKLLRVHVIVDEAEGRQIRNHAMLEQLKTLQVSMYRGYYVLDTFRYRSYLQEDSSENGHIQVSHSFALSKFNPAKRIQLCGGSIHGGEKELQQVIGSLEMIITDANEFVMFLKGCPPLYRRIYSTYLVMEKCMFGRHVEMEHIINFLMQKGSPDAGDLDVLPIVGPAKVGKSTLIEHVCNDERVLTAFSQIVFVTEDDLDEWVTFVRDCGTVKHRSHASDGDERVMFIVRVNEDISEARWSSLYSSSKRHPANGGKMIICSRSEKIARFGTARTLKLEYLTREAYWYFFKALAFGTTDPEEEPKLAAMTTEIAASLDNSFVAGNIIASLLRANLSVKFWSMVLACTKEMNKSYHFKFGVHHVSSLKNIKLIRRLNGSNEYCLILNNCRTTSSQDDVPVMTFQDILLGSDVPHGKVDVLAWRSSIPPYYSYIFSCEIHKGI